MFSFVLSFINSDSQLRLKTAIIKYYVFFLLMIQYIILFKFYSCNIKINNIVSKKLKTTTLWCAI